MFVSDSTSFFFRPSFRLLRVLVPASFHVLFLLSLFDHFLYSPLAISLVIFGNSSISFHKLLFFIFISCHPLPIVSLHPFLLHPSTSASYS
ncbi:hypothetical protein BDZ97DRAFT_1813448 [Flammula alnicola]|nr:hypothetical protein BDZ97DRAFT_1813448 [Flammula alnicola]